MGSAIAIGPLMMAVERGLAVLCIVVFLGLTTLAGRFRFPRVSTVATSAIVAGLVAARIGYVAAHWASYVEAPLSIFAVWQGGFSAIALLTATRSCSQVPVCSKRSRRSAQRAYMKWPSTGAPSLRA